MTVKTCASGDDMPHNHVFLEPAQGVLFAQGRCLGEDARGVLETGGGQKALRLDGSLGNAEQNRASFGRFAAHFLNALVLCIKDQSVDLFAPQESGVAGLGDFHLAQHLAYDHFDVLVGNGHTLQTINLLYFVH